MSTNTRGRQWSQVRMLRLHDRVYRHGRWDMEKRFRVMQAIHERSIHEIESRWAKEAKDKAGKEFQQGRTQ